MLAAFPFYSVMVGLRGTTNFSLLLPLVSELVLCQLLKGLVLSLFLIILSFWCYLPESPLLTFYFKVPSGSWPQLLTPYLFSSWLSLFLSFFPSGQNPFLLGWRFSSYFLFIVLPFGFSEIPPPLFTNGYFTPSDSLLYHWVLETDISVLHSLHLFGTPFELSQSYLSCSVCPRDPEPLATSGDPDPAFVVGLPSIPCSWQAKLFLSWVLGFKSFGLTIFFSLWWIHPFYDYLSWGWPIALFLWALVSWFLDLNTPKWHMTS